MADPKKPEVPPGIDPAILAAIDRAAAHAAKRAAESVMRRFMLRLGIDSSTPSQILEQQRDAAFLRRFRVTAEARGAKYTLAAVSAALSALGALIVLAVQYVMGRAS